MSIYHQNNFPKINIKIPKFLLSSKFRTAIIIVVISSFFGFLSGIAAGGFLYFEAREVLSKFNIKLLDHYQDDSGYIAQTTHEQKIIDVVQKNSPAVVSIIISKDVPIFEQYYINPFIFQQRQVGTEKQEIGGGTGFLISQDGMILTNRHVVLDDQAEYTVYNNEGKKFDATVLATDPVQDLAVLKIEREKVIDGDGNLTEISFPTVELGDSDSLQIGQTVIAIGNALGEFKNTVSVGVVSGLGRTITASGGSNFVETIEDVIQTDAAINKGNSGGPLLDLKGKVVGINTATVLDAQSISFAIPINKAKRDIDQIEKTGEITYPFLGVRYTMITPEIKDENNLSVDQGAWINGTQSDLAVVKDSAASKAGIKENDIITEINGEKLNLDNVLAKVLQKYSPEDTVSLKIIRGDQEFNLQAVLEKREE